MAAAAYGGVGHFDHVFGVCEEFCVVRDGQGVVGGCGGRVVAGNGELLVSSLRFGLLIWNKVLYLSHFYRRNELALRIGIFYTAASLSGAFGGLLARGLNAIGPAGGLEG
jgi:hypothetical protein